MVCVQVPADYSLYRDLSVLRHLHHDHHHPELHRAGGGGPGGGDQPEEPRAHILRLPVHLHLRGGDGAQGWCLTILTSMYISIHNKDLLITVYNYTYIDVKIVNLTPDPGSGRGAAPGQLLQGLLEHPRCHRGVLCARRILVHVSSATIFDLM